jgi:hypothetical protein
MMGAESWVKEGKMKILPSGNPMASLARAALPGPAEAPSLGIDQVTLGGWPWSKDKNQVTAADIGDAKGTPGPVKVEVVYESGNPVLTRYSGEVTLTSKSGETFNDWVRQLDKDPGRSTVTRELLRELVIEHHCPQGIKFERIELSSEEGKKYVRKLPEIGRDAIIFDRSNANGQLDYIQRGNPSNHLQG